MVGLVTSKTNSAMLDNGALPAYWNWAMFKATQDLNINYNDKIKTSPYNFVTGQHIYIKYLHSFFAECYMFIPLSERKGKLPARRAQSCRFLPYFYTTILVPTYVVISVHDNGMYGTIRRSKDVIFDESCVYDPEVDNSPSEEAFAAIIEDVTEYAPVLTHLEPVSFLPTHDPISAAPPIYHNLRGVSV